MTGLCKKTKNPRALAIAIVFCSLVVGVLLAPKSAKVKVTEF